MQYGHCWSAAVIDTRTCNYLVSEAKVRSLDNVQVFKDVVEQVLASGLCAYLLYKLLLVQKNHLEMKGLCRGEAPQTTHCSRRL